MAAPPPQDAERPDAPPVPVPPASAPSGPGRSGTRARAAAFWRRHRTLFWGLHSVWALATGVLVIFLARERYGFVPWVVLFLVLTWASTLWFGRRLREPASDRAGGTAVPGFGEEATSYAVRTMYQETLFFLLPFYAYSTVPGSLNLGFLLVLGGLAVLSCIDLVFDRWMRTRPIFGLVFFAVVAFAALNLLLPIALPLGPEISTPIAAFVALASAAPLALRGTGASPVAWLRTGGAAALLLVLALGLPQAIPPVPLRLQEAHFAASLDRETLEPAGVMEGSVDLRALDDGLAALLHVFAPTEVPTTVQLEWRAGGEVVRRTREIEITAHEGGFRVWDVWRPEDPEVDGPVEVVLRTGQGRVFGRARIAVERGEAGRGQPRPR